MGVGPKWRISGPPPVPPAYTLLAAARIVDDADAAGVLRWEAGAEVYGYPPVTASVWSPCAAGTLRVKASGQAPGPAVFEAFGVYVTDQCWSGGVWGPGVSDPQARFLERARAVLAAVEAAAVERELLTGETTANPALADGGGTFPAGDTPTHVVEAFSLLEGVLAASGRAGMIHCSPQLATVAAGHQLLRPDGPVLRTIVGTVVVPGAGYAPTYGSPQARPVGHAAPGAGQEWVFASGPVEVRRSELLIVPERVEQALDRDNNTLVYRAERFYLVDWDRAVQAAVLVDRCKSTPC